MAVLTPTAANVKGSTGTTYGAGTAGATMTAGQLVYKDASNSNKVKLADNTTTAKATVVGILVNGSSDDQKCDYISAGPCLGMGATKGVIYTASTTAGGIEPVADHIAGDIISIVGVGRSDGGIDVQIQNSGTTL